MKRFGYFLLIWFLLQIPVGFLYGLVDLHPLAQPVINIVVIVLAIFVSKIAYEAGLGGWLEGAQRRWRDASSAKKFLGNSSTMSISRQNLFLRIEKSRFGLRLDNYLKKKKSAT